MAEYYLPLKWLHIVGATVLFGTGIGTAFHFWHTLRSGNVAAIAASARATVLADWLFTSTSGVLQPITGVALAMAAGYPLSSTWIVASVALYIVAAACWLPVVFIQLRMRAIAERCEQEATQPGEEFHQLRRRWIALGWPAFIALAAVLWLMIARPA
ncbi:MAG: DUF2269 domain-containing protein [Usitatibacter sp.]